MCFIGTCLFFQSDGEYYATQEEPFRIIGVCCKKKGGAGGLSICRLLLYFTSLLIPTACSADSREFSTYVSYDKHITEVILPFVLLNVTNIEGNEYTMCKI